MNAPSDADTATSRAIRKACAIVILFVGGAGFLFGQLFNGIFSWAGTLAGIGGITAVAVASLGRFRPARTVMVVAAAVGLAGSVLHAYEYYATPQVPGNYYAWFLTGPFLVALVVLVWLSVRGTRVTE